MLVAMPAMETAETAGRTPVVVEVVRDTVRQRKLQVQAALE